MSTPFDRHVTDAEIERLVAGSLGQAEMARIGRHVVRCPACRQRSTDFPALDSLPLGVEPATGPAGGEDHRYDEAIDRAIAGLRRHRRRLPREKDWKERLVAAAREKPPYRLSAGGSFTLFADLDRKAPGVAFVEAMMELSHEARYRDLKAMQDLAFGAAMRAETLVKQGCPLPPALAADLQARALGEVANAYRRNYHFRWADETLGEAEELLEHIGTGDPGIEARLLDIRASLRIDQRQLAEAFDLLDEVHARYMELGDVHLAGRALISKGVAVFYNEQPREAAKLLREGLSLIDRNRDQKLAISAEQNLLNALVAAEDFTEASTILLRSGLRHALAAEPLNLTKLRWLEGQIFTGLGKLQRGATILAEVQDAFARQKQRYEAAMVGLELTAVLLRLGRPADAESKAEAALKTFERLGVKHEARRAVRHLREAFRQKAVSAELALRVVRFLRRLERNPLLLFRP